MKKPIGTVFYLLLLHAGFAQNLFQKIYKIHDDSLATWATEFSLFQTPDAGYVAVGSNSAKWPGSVTTLKLNPQGDLLWANQLDTASDYRNTLALDGGLVYATAQEIIRTDLNGNIVWAITDPLWSVGAYPKKIIALNDGGFVVASLFGQIVKMDANGTVLWSETVPTCNNLQSITADENSNIAYVDDCYMTELNAAGALIGRYCINCFANVKLEYIIPGNNGNFIVCGKSYTTPRFAVLFEISATGYINWYKHYTLDGSLGLAGEDVVRTPDKGYAMLTRAGYTLGDSAACIIKTDSLGNVRWAKTFDFSSVNGNTRSSTLIKTSDNGLLLSSVINEWDVTSTPVNYKAYFCFTKMDMNGHTAECSLTNSTGNIKVFTDTSFQAVPDPVTPLAFVCSSLPSNADFTGIIYPLYGCGDFTGMIIPDYTLYPNPNNGQFTLEINVTSAEGKLEVFDMLGQKICEIPFPTSTTYSFDLSFLDTGVYFLKVVDVNMPQKNRWAGKVIIAW